MAVNPGKSRYTLIYLILIPVRYINSHSVLGGGGDKIPKAAILYKMLKKQQKSGERWKNKETIYLFQIVCEIF